MKQRRMKKTVLVSVALLILASGGCATAPRSGQSMTIQTGRVVETRPVELQSQAGRGVATGGLVGYVATSRGRSSSVRMRNTILGAAAGGIIANSAEGSLRGIEYTVEVGSGARIRVVTDQTEIKVGDCVNVEQAGSGTANVRRVSPALCEAAVGNAVDTDVRQRMNESADLCLAAKDALFDAETEEQVNAAVLRVQILCDD